MKSLRGKVDIVADSSRGAGRGIALALADSGPTVYIVLRTSRTWPAPADKAAGASGGKGIAIRADLGDGEQVTALFERPARSSKFWDLRANLWRDAAGALSACWLTSVHAARLMAGKRGGLIVPVTDNHHPDPPAWRGQILHDMGTSASICWWRV
jgi:NAD(P)-dependent dehydrogenase (short-subunit alcohol dehydrogenase family)